MRALAAILTLRDAGPSEPTLEAILSATSEVTRVPIKEMKARRRPSAYARARMIYYYAATVLTSHKIEAISQAIGRERSTSSYGKCIVERDRARFEPCLSRVLERFNLRHSEAA